MKRIKNLQHLLKNISCDGVLIQDPINLFYLTGLNLSAGTLFVHAQGAELIVDGRYYEMCTCSSHPFSVHLDQNSSTLKKLLSSRDFDWMDTVGFPIENTTYESYLNLQEKVNFLNKERKQPLTLKPIANPVITLRSIKDASEIEALSVAADLGSKGFDYICSLLKEGITEVEAAAELDIFWKQQGAASVAFDPIIAFGAHSAMPHYHVGNTRLKKGDSVLIDIGVTVEHYHSDMTRVVFFGDPDPKMLVIYDIVRKAQEAALRLCRPGTLIGTLDSAARNLITGEGYGENFSHSLGHGVGLEIHEFPALRNRPPYQNIPLDTGMVITIEPGIYLPRIGGVRLENTIVITKEGYKDLTNRSTDLQYLS